jgi:hypothetical protein
MRRVLIGVLAGVLVCCFCLASSAQEPQPPAPPPPPQPPAPKPPAPKADESKKPDNSPPDQKAIDAAVKKGVEWLAKRQEKDGSFKGQYGRSYQMGATAIALLALLKSGVSRKSPAIIKGFDYLDDLPLNKMYSVALYVMALEALYAPSKKQMKRTKRSYTTVLRENLRNKSQGHDRKIISKLLEWIIGHQQKNVWRYPTGGEDLSNAQYALLALYSGLRMGYRIRPEVFKKAADYMIVYQEREGPEVDPFPVPAADFSIKDLKKLEKEIREKLRGGYEGGKSPEAWQDSGKPQHYGCRRPVQPVWRRAQEAQDVCTRVELHCTEAAERRAEALSPVLHRLDDNCRPRVQRDYQGRHGREQPLLKGLQEAARQGDSRRCGVGFQVLHGGEESEQPEQVGQHLAPVLLPVRP